MSTLPKTDVVLIGLGGAGGIASYVLTNAGLNVVGLEAGPRTGKDDFIKGYDEILKTTNPFGAPKWNKEIPTWRTNPDVEATQAYGAAGMANAVGGTTLHYTAQSWRFRTDDFLVRSTTIDRYGEDAIPAGTTMVDWPVTYEELEPFYEQVEKLIGVSGDGGSNPFESKRANDYPMPAVREDGYSSDMADAMTALGYHPFPKPLAINSEEFGGRPACSYCGFCTGYGCWNDSKGSTLVSAIAAAEQSGKLEIRPNSRVTEILTDNTGHATGVRYLDESGQEQEQPAAVVILASYVFENNRLLMLSKSDMFPNGIGNSTGQLGKNYIAHLYTILNAEFPDMKINRGGGMIGQGIGMDDLDGDNFDHTGLDFIRGSLIFPLSATETGPVALSSSLTPDAPQWGSAYKQWLQDHVHSLAGIMAQGEFLPYETNYLDLDPTVVDEIGMPVIRITYDAGANEKAQYTYMVDKMTEIVTKMGATTTWAYPFYASPVNTHDYGGTRMGNDPATSVVDSYSIMHDVPNLLVLGGSTFCSTASYNPTLTIQALAWRAADHLASNFASIGI